MKIHITAYSSEHTAIELFTFFDRNLWITTILYDNEIDANINDIPISFIII